MAENTGALRAYVVLRVAQDELTYTRVGEIEARSAGVACRTVIENSPELADDGLDFVAIPKRTMVANRAKLHIERQLKVRST